MRLLICAGGTGGGVYPALSILQALGKKADPVLWVGGEGGMEADLVKRFDVPYTAIPAAGVHGVGIRALPGNSLRLLRGAVASRRILGQFRPDALVFTGGYVAVPMAIAGRGVPSLLYIPDVEPGLALKTLARFASTIALTAEDSRTYFSAKSRLVVTGYPTRAELGSWKRPQALAHLGLQPDRKVLLVSGGSKGAQSINRAVLGCLTQLLQEVQVVHLTGQLDWPEVQKATLGLPSELASAYHAMPYLHEMGAALAAADLVISRAGASTLGEYPQFALPAILVPYPYAWRYQKVNAGYLARHNAAVIIEDHLLRAQLLPTVLDLLANEGRLEEMRRAMAALARPQAANDLASLVQELAGISLHPEDAHA